MLTLRPLSWRRATRYALPLLTATLLLSPMSSRAAHDEADVYVVDEFSYDNDGPGMKRAAPATPPIPAALPEDDPGGGGPTPTGVPLGSDLASLFVALTGAWYAWHTLRNALPPRPDAPA